MQIARLKCAKGSWIARNEDNSVNENAKLELEKFKLMLEVLSSQKK